MSVQIMQQIFVRQIETFQRKVLGIHPEKLNTDILEKCIIDKFSHLEEENTEVNKAISVFEPHNINTYYDIIDGYVDVVYILLAIQWLNKWKPVVPFQKSIIKSNYNLLGHIRRLLPHEIPYTYAFNLVHNANMKKKSGIKPGRKMTAGYDAIKPKDWKEPDWKTFCNTYLLKRKNKKILILGDAGSGKDTYAEYLSYWYGYKFVPAFKIYGPWIREQLSIIGLKYPTFNKCYEDRVNNRALWFDLISQYNKKDNSKLARNILIKSDIYPGIRSINELESSLYLFDRIIYINAKNRIPKEDFSSNEIDLEKAFDIVGDKLEIVQNNDSLLKFVFNIWKKEQEYECK